VFFLSCIILVLFSKKKEMSKRKTTSDNQDLPSVKRTRSEGKHTKAKTELFNP